MLDIRFFIQTANITVVHKHVYTPINKIQHGFKKKKNEWNTFIDLFIEKSKYKPQVKHMYFTQSCRLSILTDSALCFITTFSVNCSVERTQSCFPHINETGSLSVCAAQRFRRPRYRRGSRPHPQLRQHQDHFQVRAARNYLFTYLFIFHSVSVRSADLKKRESQ